ncbi:MAG: DNA/RNA non-specific endonuclease [Tyzzerella sp.]|nr:DNA/RNA non-specific endonuclease [Tyzzerella sp.]
MSRLRKIGAIILSTLLLTACGNLELSQNAGDAGNLGNTEYIGSAGSTTSAYAANLAEVPAYSDEPYAVINNNEPQFTESDMTTESYEVYSELDSSGRCGVAMANLGKDLMPTEDRESIGQVKPSGWQTVKYDNVDGKYLYNRCHLIGFQLAGENANERNLITGTRYMNTQGMLPFENMVADYIRETRNHVLYRVTPIFEGDNLVASGVQMEAKSVEDDGESICFNVYVYNIQPGIAIDYATGDSWKTQSEENSSGEIQTYILNTNNKKFHYEDCSSVKAMKDSNKQEYTGTREDLIKQGYEPCGNCAP